MVELRKRPPPKESLTPAPPTKKSTVASAPTGKAKGKASGTTSSEPARAPAEAVSALTPASESVAAAATSATTSVPILSVSEPVTSSGKFSVGFKVPSGAESGFGGRFQTNDGVDMTLTELLNKSKGGIVIFTYPKASTPGCTTQACLFRDSYKLITDASYSVYGLSTDSPKANTTFVTKQHLPYPLLCDPAASLTSAIGMKKPGPGKSTSRGVTVIDKDGTVQLWEQAGPQKTLDVVLDYIKNKKSTAKSAPFPTGSNVKPLSAVPAGLKDTDDGPVGDAPSPYIKDPDRKMVEAPLIRTPSQAEQDAAETALEVSEVAKRLDASARATPTAGS